MMHVIWTKVYDLLKKEFPDRPIVCTFGNNDFRIDMTPTLHQEQKTDIYGFLAKLWFKDLPYEQYESVLPSFLDGGYYV
jgi:hypothetical protein